MLRLALASLLLAATAFAAETDETTRPKVKVSLARENPDLHSAKRTKGEFVEFFLFLEGGMVRGVDFGLRLEGGEFIGYLPNFEDRAWTPLLIPDPYPGTICQAGTDCYSSPCYLGKILVRMKKPGEKITVEVMPSAFKQHALILNCDYSTTNGLRGYPAAVNAPAPEPSDVDGVEFVSQGWPDAHLSESELDSKLAPHSHAPTDSTD